METRALTGMVNWPVLLDVWVVPFSSVQLSLYVRASWVTAC
jgi:hypothetical protein